MNAFQELLRRLETLIQELSEFRLQIDEPLHASGEWTASINNDESYMLEIQWKRHLGFGLVAGHNLEFGSGVDEVYGSADATLDRVETLLRGKASTVSAPVSLADLRRLEGVLQKEAADRCHMTKSGLNQLEAVPSITALQIATLKKVIESLGGELVMKARFAKGREREISLD
jgi:hypothetical protein